MLGWDDTGGPPTALMKDGVLANKPVDVAEILSEQFDKKTREIKANIPAISTDPLKILKKAMEKWMNSPHRMEFSLKPVKLTEILDIIKNLSNSKTMGHDELDPFAIKLVAGKIAKPFTL